MARAVFGIDRYDAGEVTVDGHRLRRSAPTAAMAAGIGFVPEDRRQQGLVMDMSVQQNVALASLGRLRKGGLIRSSAERAMATDWAARLQDQVRPSRRPGGHPVRRQPAEGRARQVARPPSRSVLIVDEPTRGIDVGTKAEVHQPAHRAGQKRRRAS